MKRTLSFALAGIFACAAFAACTPVSGSSNTSDPSSVAASEEASQATSSTEETSPWLITLDSTIVDVQPLISIEPFLIDYFGTGDPVEDAKIQGLCFYTDTAGRTGVINMEGTILCESSYDVEYCPVCMLVTKEDHRVVEKNGAVSEAGIGHGGFTSPYYCREDGIVYQLGMEGYEPIPEEMLGGGIYQTVTDRISLTGFSPKTEDYVILGEGGTVLAERAEQAFLSRFDGSDHLVFGVCINGMYGFLDPQGETVIPLKYEGADVFSEGCAPVRKNGKWGYIDINDQRITEFLYEKACPVIGGKAYVQDDGLWHVMEIPGAE